MKSKEQYKENRNKILKHTRIKFHQEGFYKTSMDEIAQELQVSKKTIYKFFPSKDNLLEEICSQTSCEIMSSIDRIIEGKDDVVIKFVKILNTHSHLTMNISDKWLRDLSIHAPSIKNEIDKIKNEQINKVMKRLLDQGKKEKLIKNYPAPLIIMTFVSALTSVLMPEFLVNNKFSMQNAFTITYEMLLNGILTERGKEKFEKAKKTLAKEIKL